MKSIIAWEWTCLAVEQTTFLVFCGIFIVSPRTMGCFWCLADVVWEAIKFGPGNDVVLVIGCCVWLSFCTDWIVWTSLRTQSSATNYKSFILTFNFQHCIHQLHCPFLNESSAVRILRDDCSRPQGRDRLWFGARLSSDGSTQGCAARTRAIGSVRSGQSEKRNVCLKVNLRFTQYLQALLPNQFHRFFRVLQPIRDYLVRLKQCD